MSETVYTIKLSRQEVLLFDQMINAWMKDERLRILMQRNADKGDELMVMAHEFCLGLCESMKQKMPEVEPLNAGD